MKRHLTTICCLLALSGCADTSGSRTSVVTRTDTIAGVVHVSNSGDVAATAVVPLVRIGSSDAGPAAFGRIRSLIADADGNIYVADNLAHEIRVFDPSGRHIRTIGRRGGGPGEFGDLYSIAWLGENLAAMDPRNARIAVLSPEGQWVNGIRHYPITGPPVLVRLHPLGNEGFYTPIIGQRGPVPFVRVTTSGVTDTILAPRPPQGVNTGGVLCHRPDGGITGISVPDGPAVVYAFPPEGETVAVAWSAAYRVAVVHGGTDTVRVIARTRSAVPYPDSVWDRAIKPFDEMMAQFPGTRCDPSALERPSSRAALRHILFDEAGAMWVEAAAENGFIWEVFDELGRLRARHVAPTRSTSVPPYVRGGHLYQVEEDSLGVQHVAVYRAGSEP